MNAESAEKEPGFRQTPSGFGYLILEGRVLAGTPCHEKPFAPATLRPESGLSMPSAAPSSPSVRRLPLPTSFGGVAAVAEGPGWWLFAWQLAFALATAIVFLWAFDVAWARGIERAIGSLPDEARIQNGILEWGGTQSMILHQGPFVSFVVDPEGRREDGLATDITVSLESDRVAIRSFLGWASIRYPVTLRIPLTRVYLTSAVTAWKVPFFLALGGTVVAALLVSWLALSLAYGLVVWFGAIVLGRPVPFRIARRLAGASLLPGSVLMVSAIALYATRQMGLIGFLVVAPLHIVVGWIYCAGGWTRLRRCGGDMDGPSENPFGSPPRARGPSPEVPAASNPFQPQE